MILFQEQSWKAEDKGEEAHTEPCLRGDTQGEDDDDDHDHDGDVFEEISMRRAEIL